jgi:uncharacterized RDD family membrane protein YckC
LLFVAYFLSFWTYSGQTLGHKILGLRVVRVDGRPLSLGTAALRFLGEMLSWLVLGLGLIWVAFDVNKEGWHDKIARTRVIRTHEQLPAPAANGLGWDEQ